MISFFKHTGRVFRREIQRFARHRTFSLLSVGLPLAATLYFVVLLGKGVATDIPIAVLDQDNSILSRQAARMIDASRSPKIAYRVTDMLQAEELMRQGKIDAIVHFPKDMERDILSARQVYVMAYINGTNVTKNGLLDKDIRMTMYTFSSGIEIQTLVKKGVSQREAYELMMPVYMEKHVLFNPYINYGYYLLPLFLSMMLLMFTLMSTIFTFAVELKNATAEEWLETAGGDIYAACVGKILPYTLIFTILSLFIYTLLFKFLGAPLNGSKGMLLLSSGLFVLAYQSIGVLITGLLGNLRLGLSIGGGYSVLAFTFCGMTFPAMAMTPVMRLLTYLFPLTFHMNLFVNQAMRGAPVIWSVPDLIALTFFILLPLLVLPRMRRMCGDAKYWGRL